MSLAWYVRRMSSMSPPELLHRVGEQAKRRASRRRSFGWTAFEAHDVEIARLGPLRQALLANAAPALRSRIAASAGALLAGRFSALGVDWPQRQAGALFPDDLWRLDPVSRTLWPGSEHYCFAIPYRHERVRGDVKYLWEINRLQLLQPLAAHHALTGDAAALAAAEEAIASWSRANPPFGGLGWSSGIELALRAVSVVVALALAGEAMSDTTRRAAARLLAAHAYWLARFPSRFSSANNHLVAEHLGLFVIGLVLPGLPGAEAMARHAREGLEQEAELQILPDGVPAEQSPTYGAFTSEMLLVAGLVGRAFGLPPGGAVDGRLEAFAAHIGWLAGPDGRAPTIGDDDEGRVLTLCGPREAAYPASVANSIAGYLSRATTPARSTAPELRDALFAAPQAAAPSPAGIRSFADGGYTVVRSRTGGREAHLVMDHGPLGYLSIAAHGHADANAVVLSLDSEPVLVDPGTYLYHAGGAWRDWFRGTAAHSTLNVAGVDQSVITGPFNWGRKARAWRGDVTEGEAWSITAFHDGYVERTGAVHRRRCAAAPSGIDIHDSLEGGAGLESVELAFQCAPGIEARPLENGVALWRGPAPVLRLTVASPGEMAAMAGGEPGQGGGWVSPSFGVKVPATRIRWRGVMPRDGLLTRLRWGAPKR